MIFADIYEDNFIASLAYSQETNFDPTFGGNRLGIWIGLKSKSVKNEGSPDQIVWSWNDGFPEMAS